jgi:hypothetical protein
LSLPENVYRAWHSALFEPDTPHWSSSIKLAARDVFIGILFAAVQPSYVINGRLVPLLK